jgi:hypothetical protein
VASLYTDLFHYWNDNHWLYAVSPERLTRIRLGGVITGMWEISHQRELILPRKPKPAIIKPECFYQHQGLIRD